MHAAICGKCRRSANRHGQQRRAAVNTKFHALVKVKRDTETQAAKYNGTHINDFPLVVQIIAKKLRAKTKLGRRPS